MSHKKKLVDRELAYYSLIEQALKKNHAAQVTRAADMINAKISGLLTHISIMVAILSFFVTQIGDFKKLDLFTILIALEIFVYLLFAIGCLFGLYTTSPSTFSGTADDVMEDAILMIRRRRRIYLASLTGTIVVTVAFLITLSERIFLSFGSAA